jgi:hypothetical protein
MFPKALNTTTDLLIIVHRAGVSGGCADAFVDDTGVFAKLLGDRVSMGFHMVNGRTPVYTQDELIALVG